MNLGLLDILTAQQYQKPASEYRDFSDNRPVRDKETFASQVNKAERIRDNVYSSRPDPVREYKISGARPESQTNNTPGQYGEGVAGAVIPATPIANQNGQPEQNHPVIGFLVSQLNSEGVTNLQTLAVNDADTANDLDGVVGVIKDVLKDFGYDLSAEGDDAQIRQEIQNFVSSLQGEGTGSNILGKIVNAINAGKAQEGGGVDLFGQLVKTLVANREKPQAQIPGQPLGTTANDLPQEDVAKIINDLAGKVIEKAENAGQKPEVSTTSLQSGQASALLEIAKKESDVKSNNPLKVATQDIKGMPFGGEVKSGEEIAQNAKLDGKAFGQTVSDTAQSQGKNITANSNNEFLQNLTAGKSAVSDTSPAKLGVEPSSQQPKSEANVTLGGQIVKFEKHLSASENHVQNTTTNRFGNAKEVLAQIKFNVTNNNASKNISIQLNPKELGNVDIHMKTDADGKTKIVVLAEKTDTMNLLQKESSSLRDMLQDALKTESSNLSFSFHDKSDDNWRQSLQDGGFGNRYSNFDGSDDQLEPTAMNGNPYTGQYMTVSEGIDIKV